MNSCPRLVAYFAPLTPANAAATVVDRLRARAKAELPTYMIPSAFVRLDQMPLPPNGKIDRTAFPTPELHNAAASTADLNPLQLRIADLWRDALDIRAIGPNDDFFDLGGNSLLVLQVHTKLGEIGGAAVAIADLFRYRTIAEQSGFIERDTSSALPPLRERGDRMRAVAEQRRRRNAPS